METVDRRWMRRQSAQATLGVSCGRLRGPSLSVAMRPEGAWMSFSADSYRRTGPFDAASPAASGSFATWESAAFIDPWKAAMPPGSTVLQARSW